MANVTYGRDTIAAEPRRPGFFGRILQAFADARMREAERELRRHRHLLPRELEMSGNRLNARNEEELPFGGW